MDRITYRREDGKACYQYQHHDSTWGDMKAEQVGGTLAEKLCSYEDAEAEGRLVVLPCAVEDILYWTPSEEDDIYALYDMEDCPDIIPVSVENFDINANSIQLFLGGACRDCMARERGECAVDIVLPSVAVGVELFATIEQAEAAINQSAAT